MSGRRFISTILPPMRMLTTGPRWMVAGSAVVAIAADVPQVQEPAEIKAAVPRTPQLDRWAWNQPDVTFTPTGDMVWAPQAFAFAPGKSIRYIDFSAGSDDNDGASKEKPWKHHPWDPAATGHAREATGNLTYVFKRGVIYRGTLAAAATGAPDDRIQLTSDPSWGEGEAVHERLGKGRGLDEGDRPERYPRWRIGLVGRFAVCARKCLGRGFAAGSPQ